MCHEAASRYAPSGWGRGWAAARDSTRRGGTHELRRLENVFATVAIEVVFASIYSLGSCGGGGLEVSLGQSGDGGVAGQ